ncbi:hypothetical protein [Aquirufa nivalisilvae]|uniref:hypothetical protein n=1 Tax=Aquirufa nivalisilvae TaxID=2516557 RepID=UPI0022A9AF8B|nr:hypothetical protein [Aquirufa nivalisilvae]MCZ2479999.1 hypothetical protein [Aquirufa nivalisilvae]
MVRKTVKGCETNTWKSILKNIVIDIAGMTGFLKNGNNWSHQRLISVAGSAIVFYNFNKFPKDPGIISLMTIIITSAMGAAVISKGIEKIPEKWKKKDNQNFDPENEREH